LVKERKTEKKQPSGDVLASALQLQYAEMEAQLDEAEETLRAIRGGEVDAFAVSTPTGNRVYTLEGSDSAYRLLIEAVTEGVLTLTKDGLILFCNRRFAEMVGKPIEKVIGTSIFALIPPADNHTVRTLLGNAPVSGARAEIPLMPASGSSVSVLLSVTPLPESDQSISCMVVTDLTARGKPTSLGHVSADIAGEIRKPLSEVDKFLSALDEICQGSKTLEPKRKETAKEFYRKAKSASEKIENVIRRVSSLTKAPPTSVAASKRRSAPRS
jgi:PAS domain S-box-containing protein